MTGLKVANHGKIEAWKGVKIQKNARNVIDNFKASAMPELWRPCNYDINGTDPLG